MPTSKAMTVKETLARLKALGDEKVRKHNTKNGASDKQFGVKHGDIRKLAAEIKTNHELAIALWKTGNADAQFLAILLIKPKTCRPTRWIGWFDPSTFRMWRTG